MDSGTLAVPGADLYYEVRGSGPVLLMINGSNGDTALYAGLADRFADRRTVVTYDRRGNSRSRLTGPPEEQRVELRVEQHTDDAFRLLRELTAEPAAIFGSSTGAAIGLDLLARHPERVELLVAHEPLVLGMLPEPKQWHARFDAVCDLFVTGGARAAMDELCTLLGVAAPPEPAAEMPASIRELLERVQANVEFNFSCELRAFSRFEPDLTALRGAPLVTAVGAEGVQTLLYRTTALLAERLDLPVTEFPGDHMSYAMRPEETAEALAPILERK
ncbi:alpha/beta hydrolase [Embleya sp. NBC_00888]|uniref:alpha/beta fold hydrolase n=1 Tax=Embleya sp. NBC_00888 TaxID=2975960 RepID=UPI003863B702|nr:alpha/beta hydrolase [Embleya sp. NBC_00888]